MNSHSLKVAEIRKGQYFEDVVNYKTAVLCFSGIVLNLSLA